MTKLAIHHLRKSFNQHVILEDVSFSAEKGQVVALMGSSGSGKSTLLRCINLLVVPDQGQIQVDQDILSFGADKAPISQKKIIGLRKRIGMVFQQFNLWSHMTVLENLIEAPVHVLKQDKKAAIEEANILLAKVGLSDRIHHYPSQLSGGQQQRAAIARALMMKPEIMLFDEPTSALDPEMVGEVLTVMQQLAQEGMTMVVSTHELNFARHVAHQSVFLDQGKIIEQGVTSEMFMHPKTERFQKFLQAIHH